MLQILQMFQIIKLVVAKMSTYIKMNEICKKISEKNDVLVQMSWCFFQRSSVTLVMHTFKPRHTSMSAYIRATFKNI